MRRQRAAIGRLIARLVDSSDRALELAHLRRLGGVRYGIDPRHPGLILRLDADGTRTYGRLNGRVFVPADAARPQSPVVD